MNEFSISSPATAVALSEPIKPPVKRLLWQLFVFTAFALLAHGLAIVVAVPAAIVAGRQLGQILIVLLSGVGILIISAFLVRRFQHLSLSAIGIGRDRPWKRQLFTGAIFGGTLIALAWLISWRLGWLSFEPTSPSGKFLRLFVAMILCVSIALYEELLCRGYAFQLIYRRSPMVALALGGLVFVAIHLSNTGGTDPVAIINLLISHLFLATCYLRTRSLWLPIGIHIGWNFTEGFVLGMPLSGRTSNVSLLHTTMESNYWTGHEFGPEGGLFVTVVLIAALLIAWRFLKQRHPAIDLLAHAETDTAPQIPRAELTPSISKGPTTPQDRFLALDALRGIAVFSILPMNMQIFALFPATVIYPYAGEFVDATNIWVWTLLRVFIGTTGLIAFSLLFGAGILMTESGSRSGGRDTATLHYRRMAILFVFGLVHAYCIWSGDILVTYAICGSLVFLLRGLKPGWLLVLGVLAFLVPMSLLLVAHFVLPNLSPEFTSGIYAGLKPDPERLAEFTQAYSGGWLAQAPQRIIDALLNQTVNLFFCMGWIAAGSMLAGMALHKHGVFTGRASNRMYALMIAAAILIGLPLLIYSFVWSFQREWRLTDGFFLGWFFRECSYPLIVLGWIGAVMLMSKHDRLKALIEPLAPVGRMAMTNYLMHSVICSFLFYGHGFGLIGKLDHFAQIWITLAIWVLQLVLSPLWLRYFRFGPAEWLWRSLTYGRREPMTSTENLHVQPA